MTATTAAVVANTISLGRKELKSIDQELATTLGQAKVISQSSPVADFVDHAAIG
jgi:hypothetical protein